MYHIKKIKNLVKITSGIRYPDPTNLKYWNLEKGHSWLKGGDVKDYIFDSKLKVTEIGMKKFINYKKYFFKKDSFVMISVGYVGKIGWLKKNMFVSDSIFNFDCDDLILKKYLYYFFKKNRQKIFNLKKGTAIPTIKIWQIEILEINLPDHNTQKKVVEELDHLYHYVQQKLKTLKIEKKFFQNLLEFKLHYFFNDFKDHKYQKEFIENIVKITKGRHYPSPSDLQFWNHQNGFLWLKCGDIKPYILNSKCKLSQKGVETIKNAQNFLFKKNSFVLGMVGSGAGKVGWINENFFALSDIINFNCEDLILKKYLYYFLKKNRSKIFNLKTGTAIPRIKLWQLERLEINLPDSKTQKKVVEELDYLFHYVQQKTKTLEKEEKLFQELLEFKLHYFYNFEI